MDIAGNTRLLAEWSALVAELDRVTRESLGVNDRGFSEAALPGRPERRRSRSFLSRGLSFFNTNPMEQQNRPRSKSILVQLGGMLRSPRKSSLATPPESPSSPKAWNQLTPPNPVERRSAGKLGSRLSPHLPQSLSAPPRRRLESSSPNDGQDEPAPRRLLKKQEQLRLALAIHKEKARRRSASGMAQSAEDAAVSTQDAMREVARAVAQARIKAQADVNVPSSRLTPPSLPRRGTWSAAVAGVTAGPHAGRLLVELVRCRDQSRDRSLDFAASAAPIVGWI